MSNRAEHDLVGVIVGTSLAVYQARSLSGGCICLEAVGGLAGSRLPDIFDPPTHPGHRALAHGVLPMGAIGFYITGQLAPWQEQMRGWADDIARSNASDPQLAAALLEAILRLATGFLAGAAAGYAFHLILDARTRRSLPLVT